MASFKAKFPVLQELFAKNHRGGPLGPPPPPPAGRGLVALLLMTYFAKIISGILKQKIILLFCCSISNKAGVKSLFELLCRKPFAVLCVFLL